MGKWVVETHQFGGSILVKAKSTTYNYCIESLCRYFGGQPYPLYYNIVIIYGSKLSCCWEIDVCVVVVAAGAAVAVAVVWIRERNELCGFRYDLFRYVEYFTWWNDCRMDDLQMCLNWKKIDLNISVPKRFERTPLNYIVFRCWSARSTNELWRILIFIW